MQLNRKYILIDRIVFIVYILCIVAFMSIFGWYKSEMNRIQQEKEDNRVKPIYEKIVEYADDDPLLIRKEPPDVIEETEDEIIEEVEEEMTQVSHLPNTQITKQLGRVQGPQNEESWYNLPMHNVINTMREMGYTEADYPHYVREDGVKMLGDFIMVAANLEIYPRGTVVQTSLGQGLVCDKCEHGQEFDIAVEW